MPLVSCMVMHKCGRSRATILFLRMRSSTTAASPDNAPATGHLSGAYREVQKTQKLVRAAFFRIRVTSGCQEYGECQRPLCAIVLPEFCMTQSLLSPLFSAVLKS